ncbi:hypothetical protein GCM10010166_20230 [Couchioplanes caeruleus subsp. azureus]|nr:hypothetical protein GCM10010166_20230 [Couchioplanes caeruleus subsp. azureus]
MRKRSGQDETWASASGGNRRGLAQAAATGAGWPRRQQPAQAGPGGSNRRGLAQAAATGAGWPRQRQPARAGPGSGNRRGLAQAAATGADGGNPLGRGNRLGRTTADHRGP